MMVSVYHAFKQACWFTAKGTGVYMNDHEYCQQKSRNYMNQVIYQQSAYTKYLLRQKLREKQQAA
jgi:hypothetical protein